jgi:Asp/Glu/hydantoin racemase
MTTDVNQCLNQAESALESQNLTPVQTDAISIAGQSDEATAVFVCMESPSESPVTTVMVIVSSADDDQAIALREALKQAF